MVVMEPQVAKIMVELHTAKNQLEEATAVEEVGATDQLLLLPADMEVADPAVDTEVNQVEEEADTTEVIFLTCWISDSNP